MRAQYREKAVRKYPDISYINLIQRVCIPIPCIDTRLGFQQISDHSKSLMSGAPLGSQTLDDYVKRLFIPRCISIPQTFMHSPNVYSFSRRLFIPYKNISIP